MRHVSFTKKSLLAEAICLCMWSGLTNTALPQNRTAAPATGTKTQNFPLWPVDKTGQSHPQISAQTDVGIYAGSPSYRSFLENSVRNTPEGALASYLETLRQPDVDVEKAIRLYVKDEYKDAEGRDNIRRTMEREKRNMQRVSDVQYHSRYDVGLYTMLFSEYVGPKGERIPLGYFFLHKEEGGYRLTKKIGDAITLFYLIGSYCYDFGSDGNWNHASNFSYKYSLRVPSPFPEDGLSVHPFKVSFNGTPSNVLLNDRWNPSDTTGQFFKRVVQTYRTGSREQWLELWTPEAKKFWNGNETSTRDTYKIERKKLSGNNVHLVFTLDFGPSVALFFLNENDVSSAGLPTINYLLAWKGNGQYLLTQGEKLPSGEITFVGNITSFFSSQPFQDTLRSIVEKAYPALANKTKNPATTP